MNRHSPGEVEAKIVALLQQGGRWTHREIREALGIKESNRHQVYKILSELTHGNQVTRYEWIDDEGSNFAFEWRRFRWEVLCRPWTPEGLREVWQ